MHAISKPDRSAGLSTSTRPILRVLWVVVRTPILAVLTVFEPVVRTVVSLLIIIGLFVAVVFEISAVGPHFSFLLMMAIVAGLAAFLVGYYAVLALLSR